MSEEYKTQNVTKTTMVKMLDIVTLGMIQIPHSCNFTHVILSDKMESTS